MDSRDPAKDIQYHVQELRSRLAHSIIVLLILSGLGIYFSGEMLAWLQNDLQVGLNALTPYETIYTRIMIGVMFGFFTSLPVMLYQMLKFAEPGLKTKEYRVIRNFLPFSFILFIIGGAFSYTFIVKKSLSFFQHHTETAAVNTVWGLQNTIGFSLKLSAVAGALFQLPIVSMVLAKAGIINAEMMKKYRAYFIVGILVLAAVSTPPDLVTQIMITVPIIGLYELSIFLVSRIQPF